ncbi:hypothetical protein LWM68_07035 [Niabella sp. W65]|nr:hypothetical protein [Niabella sp. W65]MCH7362548.1 hypothetical protein [Niabella sp. W65]
MLNVKVVSDQAEAVIKILDKKVLNKEITESDWQSVFLSEGYLRLQKRERSLNRTFDDSTFKKFVLADSTINMKKAFTETLEKWKAANMSEVSAYAFAYLPPGVRIRAKVYPVIKPRSNSFVFEYPDDPAIFLYLDPNANKRRFETTLAHELHHIGFGSGCSSYAEKRRTERLSDNMKNVLNWLGSLGEGFATLAAAGTPDINPYEDIFPQEIANWNNDILNYNANLKILEKFFLDLAEGKLSKEKINETGFSFLAFQDDQAFGMWLAGKWV